VTVEFLPFSKPEIGEEEIAEVVDTLRSGWLTTGNKTRQFENAFADYLGVQNALAVNSATAGLHLALEAIGVGPGDKVITTVYTFTATAEVIRYMGADPVFVDIDPVALNIDPQKLEEAILQNENVKAIMPVHFAGLACDMASIKALARKYSLKIIEDAAHAFPAQYKGEWIGKIGDITVFSFYANKTMTTGEGGMVVTDNSEYAERIRVMRLHGISRDVFDRYQSTSPSWSYDVVAPGFKYNLTDIASSIGIHQLAKAEKFREARESISEKYTSGFSDLPLQLPAQSDGGDVHAWHLYVAQVNENNAGIDREKFINMLAERAIGTSVHFIPLHYQTYWKEKYSLQSEDFPIASSVFSKVVSLPLYAGMNDEQVDRVIDAVRDVFC